MIPRPEKPVTEIAYETLSNDLVRSGNRYWTEITAAMFIGHYFGSRFGYLKLAVIGAMCVGMNILLNIIKENLSTDFEADQK